MKIECKSFLRWAGGKRWLLKDINDFLPIKGFNNYHEPFVGGGAVFFHLQPKKAYISDLNSDLIQTYIQVRDNVKDVIKYLKQFKNTKEDYYHIRKTVYKKPAKQAARFIYLNQTSFNGIYRVNLKGEYNVPYGNRINHKINYDNLLYAHNVLQNATIACQDFKQALNNVKEGDLVFLDPPYTVTHNDNGFIKYNQKLFSVEEQYRLSNMINEIKERNAYYILTNAAHPKIKEIFNHGDLVFELKRASLVGGKNAARGKYAEIVITNGRK
jgi:DNA adenine methylase